MTITVTGILAGQTTPTTVDVYFYSTEHMQQCDRLVLLAMSKPGKYQLRIGEVDSNDYVFGGCKLIRLTP